MLQIKIHNTQMGSTIKQYTVPPNSTQNSYKHKYQDTNLKSNTKLLKAGSNEDES